MDGDREFWIQQKNRKGSGKHLKSEPIFQGLWKRENDTRNHSSFSPNRDGAEGEATARFRVFLSDSEDSMPKPYNRSCHHRCRYHGSHFHWLQIQIYNERGIYYECEK